MRVTVATFNLRNSRGADGRNSWVFRRRNALRVIRQLGADVVALQEVRAGQLRWLGRRLGADFVVHAVARDGGRGEHMVIALRHTLGRASLVRPRWFTATPDVPGRHDEARFNRMALAVTVAVAGRDVTFVGTHLDERSEAARRDAAARLASWFPGSAVLLGDFNCTIDDPVLAPLFAAGYVDALAPLPPAGSGVATHHGFSGSCDGTRIDHVLVPHAFPVLEARVVHDRPPGPLPSDHWPVVATIEIA